MKRLLPYLIGAALVACTAPSGQAAPVVVTTQSAAGVSVRVARVDLKDPQTILTILLANNAPRANTMQETFGDEPFGALVARARSAAVINGTFFAKNTQKTVMGNMVRAGAFVKYSQWENFGTTFGLRAGNVPEMVTARDINSQPDWKSHFFSVTCGPRLIKDGQIWLNPTLEGFSDPHVLGVGGRSALGYSRDGATLMLVSFGQAVTLQKEAEVMKALNAYQAMNLDGGASQALAVAGKVIVPAGRNLTNVIAVYDQKFLAPDDLRQAARNFTAAPVLADDPGPARVQPVQPAGQTPVSLPEVGSAAAQLQNAISTMEAQLRQHGPRLPAEARRQMQQAIAELKQQLKELKNRPASDPGPSEATPEEE